MGFDNKYQSTDIVQVQHLKGVLADIRDLKIALKKYKLVFIIIPILCATVGYLIGFFQKPIYKAESTFVLEGSEKGLLGQYAGLASTVGIDIGGGGTSGLFQGDNIIELYKSQSMMIETLLTSQTNGKGLLIDEFIAFRKLRDKWDASLKNIVFDKRRKDFTIKHDSILKDIAIKIIKENLSVRKIDKKLSIIDVSVVSENESFSKGLVDQLVSTVNAFYVRTKTSNSTENVNIIQHQVDSVRKKLNQAIGSVAYTTDANPNMNTALQSIRVPSVKKQVDVESNRAILMELVKNLEIAKVSLLRERPLIQIIDKPILPLEKKKAPKIIFAAIGLLIGLFLSSFYVISLNINSRINTNQ